jgi:hypothetical protein
LGHSQPSTTHRYAHLDSDPLRKASESIAQSISLQMGDSNNQAVFAPSQYELQ